MASTRPMPIARTLPVTHVEATGAYHGACDARRRPSSLPEETPAPRSPRPWRARVDRTSEEVNAEVRARARWTSHAYPLQPGFPRLALRSALVDSRWKNRDGWRVGCEPTPRGSIAERPTFPELSLGKGDDVSARLGRFEALLDAIPAPLAVLDVASSCSVLTNRRFVELTGVDAASCRTHSFRQAFLDGHRRA